MCSLAGEVDKNLEEKLEMQATIMEKTISKAYNKGFQDGLSMASEQRDKKRKHSEISKEVNSGSKETNHERNVRVAKEDGWHKGFAEAVSRLQSVPEEMTSELWDLIRVRIADGGYTTAHSMSAATQMLNDAGDTAHKVLCRHLQAVSKLPSTTTTADHRR